MLDIYMGKINAGIHNAEIAPIHRCFLDSIIYSFAHINVL